MLAGLGWWRGGVEALDGSLEVDDRGKNGHAKTACVGEDSVGKNIHVSLDNLDLSLKQKFLLSAPSPEAPLRDPVGLLPSF